MIEKIKESDIKEIIINGKRNSKETMQMLRKLEDMCHDINFNQAEALNIIKQIDINQEFQKNEKYGFSYTTILVAEAIDNYNVRMLSLLLDNGADPNQIYANNESELWNLQYYYGNSDEENETRLKMAHILLKYGANPNIMPLYEPDYLFDWVWHELYEYSEEHFEYLGRFFVLLVAYGARARDWEPTIIREFNKEKMEEYRFYFLKEKILDFCGIIVDKNNTIFAYI